MYRLGNATIVRYALKADGGTDAIPKRGYDHDSGYEPMQHRRWFTERCTTLRADVRRTAERNNKAKQPVTLNGFHMFML